MTHTKNKKNGAAKLKEKHSTTKISDEQSQEYQENHATRNESKPEVDTSRGAMVGQPSQNSPLMTSDPIILVQLVKDALAPLLKEQTEQITNEFKKIREEINCHNARIEELENLFKNMQIKQEELE